MILYPAIDLKDGQCVRLQQGLMDKATVFNLSPADQARDFADRVSALCTLSISNGAFEGRSVNADAVSSIFAAVQIPVQLGGGIRNLDSISFWLERGVARVILGTAAVRDPDACPGSLRPFPGQDRCRHRCQGRARGCEGWAETSELSAVELARRFEDTGVAAIIYTDIGRDGMLTGLNLDATAEIARAVSIPVIASGGLAGIEDIERLLAAICDDRWRYRRPRPLRRQARCQARARTDGQSGLELSAQNRICIVASIAKANEGNGH